VHSTRNRGARWLAPAIVAVLALVLAACGDDGDSGGASTPTTTAASSSATTTPGPTSGPGSPAPQPLPERTSATIAMGVAIEPFAAPLLAEAMGEFEKENLDVSVEIVPPNDGLLLLANGDIDMQVAGIGGGTLNAIDSGVDVRYVANTHAQHEDNHEGLWVRNEYFGPDGKPIADQVRGMTVAVGAQGVGAVSTIPLQRWLETMGLTISDVELSPLQGADILTALEQGSVGAGYVLTPHWQLAEAADWGQLVTPTPPIAAAGYLFSGKTLEEKPEVADAIMRALTRTVRTYLQGDYHDDAEVMTVLAEVLQQPEASIASAPSLVFDPDMTFDVELLEEVQDVWIGVGGVLEFDEPLPASQVVDDAVIQRILG
jgi:NitT/TauT family transport system substrate-binding protein